MSSPPASHEAPIVMDASFEAHSFSTLELDVSGVHTKLRPHAESNQVEVRGFVPDSEAEQAREIFDRRGIATHQSQDRLFLFEDGLSADVEDWRWRREHPPTVGFEVRLPPSLDVDIQAPGGTIDASGLSGSVHLNVMGGTVEASDLQGHLHVQGGGGPLRVQQGSDLNLTLRWTSGPILLEHVTSPSTSVRAVAADTTVHDLHGPVDLSVQGASLTLQDVGGPCEAQVHGGPLTYRGAPTKELALTTIGGPLRTSLPLSHGATVSVVGTSLSLDEAFALDGERSDHQFEGTLNGGGPSLHLRAVQGVVQCMSQ